MRARGSPILFLFAFVLIALLTFSTTGTGTAASNDTTAIVYIDNDDNLQLAPGKEVAAIGCGTRPATDGTQASTLVGAEKNGLYHRLNDADNPRDPARLKC